MGRVAAARIGLQVLEGAPELDEHRSPWASEIAAGTKEPGSRPLLELTQHPRHPRRKMGSHFHACQNLLIRMPIRKTTKAPSISAVTRLSMTCAVAMPFPRPHLDHPARESSAKI